MGLLKRVFRPVRKIAKKIIPKEIRPALPFLAAAIPGAQGLASLNAFMNPAAQKALLAGVTSAATDEDGNPLRAAALAAAPDVLSGGLGKIASQFPMSEADETLSFVQKVGEGARRGKDFIERQSALKTIGAQTALDQSAKFAEIRQDEIDEYNRSLREQGVLDKTKRRTAIFNIYKNAGYDDDYVNSMLDRYGYDEGGIVEALRALKAKMRAPETVAREMSGRLRRKPTDDDNDDDMIIPPKKPKEDKDEEKPVPVVDANPDYARAMKDAMTGVEVAFGIPFGGVAPAEFKRFARGGEVVEEVEESGIMTASVPGPFDDYDDIAMQLFGKGYKDLTPEEMELMQEELERLMNKFRSQASDEGIMQMASGYKDDIEEMYEQYVFEMEEMGLEPMSFSQFLARERAGMEDGGKVRRRRKGEPADEVIEEETQEEYFLDKMPKPKRQGIMEAADGGIMEKDMRGGGFIPEGSKERADDVPARLSKNEFVMTADAVRAAGGGSVNKGAKRMYDMMYSLEGKI